VPYRHVFCNQSCRRKHQTKPVAFVHNKRLIHFNAQLWALAALFTTPVVQGTVQQRPKREEYRSGEVCYQEQQNQHAWLTCVRCSNSGVPNEPDPAVDAARVAHHLRYVLPSGQERRSVKSTLRLWFVRNTLHTCSRSGNERRGRSTVVGTSACYRKPQVTLRFQLP